MLACGGVNVFPEEIMTETKPTPPNSQSKPDSAAAEKAKAAEVEKAKAAEVEKAKAADKQEKNPSPEPQKGPGTTSNQTSNLGENSALPEPPDVTPIPTDAELNELDARHGYRPAIEAVTVNEPRRPILIVSPSFSVEVGSPTIQ